MPEIMNFSPLWGVWTIGNPLGSGTFGDVYEARRIDAGREYVSAIKHIPIPPKGTTIQMLYADGIVTDDASARSYCQSLVDTLLKEIDICYELKGFTNFVSYEDHLIVPRQGEPGFDVFIRMEQLTSLQNYIAANGITVGGITKLCEDMCTALGVLERKRIIHRDIKPANIFVSNSGDFKLGDFGVARHMEGLGSVSVKGTYNYMPPEILRGAAAGSNSDLYSLGLVLYRLLNYNRAPFLPPPPAQIGHEQDQSALDRRLSGEPLIPPARAELSLPLTNVIMCACEYAPAKRYQTADEMKRALQNFNIYQSQGGFDPDATIALERTYPAPDRLASNANASQWLPASRSAVSPGAYSAMPPSAQPKPPTNNKAMFAIIFSALGVVVLLLVIVLVLVLPKKDGGNSVGTTPIVVQTLTPTSSPSPTPIPTASPTPEPTPTPLITNRMDLYNPQYTYAFSEISYSSRASDTEAELAAACIVEFNEAWTQYMTYRDEKVFDYLDTASSSYQYALKHKNENPTLSQQFLMMDIQEVRTYGSFWFVWVHEIIEETIGDEVKRLEYHWVYKISHSDYGFTVHNFANDPQYK